MQFIDAVNRILRLEGKIRGDNDVLTTFVDTTLNASSSLSQIAIQDEITELISRGLLSYQHKSSTITLLTGIRSYALPSDFTGLWGEPPFFYDPVQNVEFYEFPGGENSLRRTYYDYLTTLGAPNYWYLEKTTTNQVSWFQVPGANFNGKVYNFEYYADVNVVNSTDIMPFITTNQFNIFCGMAAIRFRFLYRQLNVEDLNDNPIYRANRSILFNLIRGKKAASRYGSAYLSPG